MSHIEGQDTAYWDERFSSGDWAENGGNYQSLSFMRAILTAAFASPAGDFLRHYADVEVFDNGDISHQKCRIIDHGCAEGDGTAVIQSFFPMADVTGMDWSETAVAHAKMRWPTIAFTHGDIENPHYKADIIITSHTIEHLTDPAGTINNLLNFCRLLIVAVPPVSQEENGGHAGAIPIAEWKAKTTPLYESGFNTVRVVGKDAWAEGTQLLIYKGNLT